MKRMPKVYRYIKRTERNNIVRNKVAVVYWCWERLSIMSTAIQVCCIITAIRDAYTENNIRMSDHYFLHDKESQITSFVIISEL